jgi:hypothetical protein
MHASFQFATMAITMPTIAVLRFCTINARTSPAMVLIDAASADSLEPIAPLKNTKDTENVRVPEENGNSTALMYSLDEKA